MADVLVNFKEEIKKSLEKYEKFQKALQLVLQAVTEAEKSSEGLPSPRNPEEFLTSIVENVLQATSEVQRPVKNVNQDDVLQVRAEDYESQNSSDSDKVHARDDSEKIEDIRDAVNGELVESPGESIHMLSVSASNQTEENKDTSLADQVDAQKAKAADKLNESNESPKSVNLSLNKSEEFIDAMISLGGPKIGVKYNIEVTSPLDTDGTFWACLITSGFIQDKLEPLSDLLRSATRADTSLWKVDDLSELVCVKSHSNGLWMRAIVIKETNDHSVKIRFVDVGRTEETPRSRLSKVPAPLAKIPYMAFHCLLFEERVNMQYEDKWRFSDLCKKKVLHYTCEKFVERNGKKLLVGKMQTITDDPGLDVTEEIRSRLKDRGLSSANQESSAIVSRDFRATQGISENAQLTLLSEVIRADLNIPDDDREKNDPSNKEVIDQQSYFDISQSLELKKDAQSPNSELCDKRKVKSVPPVTMPDKDRRYSTDKTPWGESKTPTGDEEHEFLALPLFQDSPSEEKTESQVLGDIKNESKNLDGGVALDLVRDPPLTGSQTSSPQEKKININDGTKDKLTKSLDGSVAQELGREPPVTSSQTSSPQEKKANINDRTKDKLTKLLELEIMLHQIKNPEICTSDISEYFSKIVDNRGSQLKEKVGDDFQPLQSTLGPTLQSFPQNAYEHNGVWYYPYYQPNWYPVYDPRDPRHVFHAGLHSGYDQQPQQAGQATSNDSCLEGGNNQLFDANCSPTRSHVLPGINSVPSYVNYPANNHINDTKSHYSDTQSIQKMEVVENVNTMNDNAPVNLTRPSISESQQNNDGTDLSMSSTQPVNSRVQLTSCEDYVVKTINGNEVLGKTENHCEISSSNNVSQCKKTGLNHSFGLNAERSLENRWDENKTFQVLTFDEYLNESKEEWSKRELHNLTNPLLYHNKARFYSLLCKEHAPNIFNYRLKKCIVHKVLSLSTNEGEIFKKQWEMNDGPIFILMKHKPSEVDGPWLYGVICQVMAKVRITGYRNRCECAVKFISNAIIDNYSGLRPDKSTLEVPPIKALMYIKELVSRVKKGNCVSWLELPQMTRELKEARENTRRDGREKTVQILRRPNETGNEPLPDDYLKPFSPTERENWELDLQEIDIMSDEKNNDSDAECERDLGSEMDVYGLTPEDVE